ncbi:MAG TPA: hydroxyisourate hydrolase [Actinomycetota bacterium]|nr:hydroxyisourate hydrolase [Actinomycetota bacterium]
MAGISTHVLDTAAGVPAAGVPVTLEVARASGWERVGAGVTDEDGRVVDLLVEGAVVGTYRIVFDTGAYFTARGEPGFYPEVSVVFEVKEAHAHHHVPLLLSPFGYSTYRGS